MMRFKVANMPCIRNMAESFRTLLSNALRGLTGSTAIIMPYFAAKNNGISCV